MGTVRRVQGAAEARELAALLNGSERSTPTVVVSVPAAADAPYIDPEEILNDVGDLCEVYLIRTGADTFSFSDGMPDLTHVYGGAGRVYPVDNTWVTDPYRSPLRFAFDQSQGRAACRDLISDALRMAADAGLVATKMRTSLPRRTGQVRGFPTPERALVRLDDGTFATVVQELTLPHVPLERVLAKGMRVSGLYDEHSRRLDVRAELLPADEALRRYEHGDVVLAQVDTLEATVARVLLHPGVGVTIRRENVSSNELDDLTSLMTPGEVLTARTMTTSPDWQLSLIDVEDDEVPRAAASLLVGGPPWLLPQHEVTPDVQATPVDAGAPAGLPLPPEAKAPATEPPSSEPSPVAAAHPRPTPAIFGRRLGEVASADTSAKRQPTPAVRDLSLALDAARAALTAAEHERDQLAAQVRALQGERALAATHVDELSRQRDHMERQLEQSRTARRRAARRQSRNAAGDGGPWFLDPDRQFRFEVDLAWARRIPAAEKEARPLHAYEIGPEFLTSVAAITGISRGKIVDVVVEVATGLVTELAGRDLHPLRTDESGNAPQLARSSDGAKAWRVALQRDVPQARRLHYWQCPGGIVELSRVVLHDDYAA